MCSDEAWRVGRAAAVAPLWVGGVGLIVAAAAAIFAGEGGAVWLALIGRAGVVVWRVVAASVPGKTVQPMDAESPES